MNRRRLPDRRGCETILVECDGQKFVATVGYFPSTREPAEIFINTAQRQGSAADINAADAAVAVSLALQYGCPVNALRSAMKRDPAGKPQGPLGAVLDMLAVPDDR